MQALRRTPRYRRNRNGLRAKKWTHSACSAGLGSPKENAVRVVCWSAIAIGIARRRIGSATRWSAGGQEEALGVRTRQVGGEDEAEGLGARAQQRRSEARSRETDVGREALGGRARQEGGETEGLGSAGAPSPVDRGARCISLFLPYLATCMHAGMCLHTCLHPIFSILLQVCLVLNLYGVCSMQYAVCHATCISSTIWATDGEG